MVLVVLCFWLWCWSSSSTHGILDERGLTGEVGVSAGGPRGMNVTVTLPDGSDGDIAELQELLDGYQFQATVMR